MPESDHLPLLFRLNLNQHNTYKEAETKGPVVSFEPHFKYIWKQENLNLFVETLDDSVSDIYRSELYDVISDLSDVDTAAQCLNSFVNQACHRVFKKKMIKKIKLPKKSHVRLARIQAKTSG